MMMRYEYAAMTIVSTKNNIKRHTITCRIVRTRHVVLYVMSVVVVRKVRMCAFMGLDVKRIFLW
jgi:hypothetical protein